MSSLILAMLLSTQATPAAAPGTAVRALTLTLLGSKDAPVADVGPMDVALIENGVARDVISFVPDRRPVSLALVIDSSEAIASGFRLEVLPAVSGFVSRLPEGARYAVWTTGDRPTKIEDFTEDRTAAGTALTRVAPQGGNTLLDAVAEAAADLGQRAREGDRRVLVAVTATGPELSHRDKYRAVEEAENKVDLFLSVQIDVGEEDFETRASLGYLLGQLSERTGGTSEIVLSPMSVSSALRKLSSILRGGYRLAYATVPRLKRRQLELKVARPNTKVLLPAVVPES